MQKPTKTTGQLQSWWRPTELAEESCWHCRIGPLQLYFQRSENQWLFASEQLSEAPEHDLVFSQATAEIPEELTSARYIFKSTPRGFRLRPRLLDRPLVVKTSQPVNLPPGESVTFYISSPVLVEVSLFDKDFVLGEYHTVRLSDTWFGPSTQVGELCYASKTRARNSSHNMRLQPHRAVTPLTIDNRADDLLAIDKLSLPLPMLAVYGKADGTLWTDPVSLKHVGSAGFANLNIESQASTGELLAAARTPAQKGGLVRAFTSIFSDA